MASHIAHIARLEEKLANKRIEAGPTYDFVPKVHDQHDMAKWFCLAVHALGNQDAAKLVELCNALRQSIWDVVQDVEPINDDNDADVLDRMDKRVRAVVKEMVRLMKFRVVACERTTRQLVEYTQSTIAKARQVAKALLRKQDELSSHIQSQALHLKQEKIGQLPVQVEAKLVVDKPSFGSAFQVQAQGSSKQATMDALKAKALQLYKTLAELRDERVHAILSHDKPRVQAIDAQVRKLHTQTRAITGARQHLASLVKDEPILGGEASTNESAQAGVERLAKAMTQKKVLDHDLYKYQVEHEIDEHATGMALYLGLKTQKEIAQLKHDLQESLCKVAAQLFQTNAQEIELLNQEMAALHNQLRRLNHTDMDYLERMAKRYRANVAKIQLQILSLFDKR